MFYEHVGQNMFVGHMFVGPKPANLPTVYKLVRTKEFVSFWGSRFCAVTEGESY